MSNDPSEMVPQCRNFTGQATRKELKNWVLISEIRGEGVQARIGDSFPIQVISRKEEKIRIGGM